MITFTCAGCGYTREVPNDFALRTVTCPKCKEKGLVPEPPLIPPMPPPFDLRPTRHDVPPLTPPPNAPPTRPYWRADGRRQRSLTNGVILFLLQVVFIVPYLAIAFFVSPKSLGATTADVVMAVVALVFSFLAALSYLVTPFWIASHSKGRGAETPLWCIVGLTPLLGLAIYLIANHGVDLE